MMFKMMFDRPVVELLMRAVSCTRCSVEAGAVMRGVGPYAKLASANFASSSGVVDAVAVGVGAAAYSSRSLPTVAIHDDRYRGPANAAYSVGGGRY